MSAIYPIQSDFSGGEISPRVSARTRMEWYYKSLAEMTNFSATPQGSALRRSGSEYFFETLNNAPARQVQFSRGISQDYVVEFTSGAIRMYNRDGVVQKLGGELLINRDFALITAGKPRDWNLTSNTEREIDIGLETRPFKVMDWEQIAPALKVNQYKYASNELPGANYVQIVQTVTAEEISPGVYADHTLVTDMTLGGTLEDPSSLQVTINVGDGVDPIAYFDDTFLSSELSTETFTPTGPTITVLYRFDMNAPAGDFYPAFAQIQGLSLRPSVADPLIITTGDPTDSSVPWVGDEIFELDVAMDLGGGDDGPDRLWIAHPNYPPHLLVRISQNNWECYDLLDGLAPIQIIGAPADWGVLNYPSTVELFSGRSWFSGVPDSRSQIWGSQAGNYFVFTAGANAGDPLDLQLVTRGAIQWLKGQKAMLIGTDLGEHTIVSSTGLRAVAVGDIDVLEQSSNGSVPIEPLIIGSEVVYISPDKTKLYATDYVRDSDGWLSKDLSWIAEHITRSGIARHVWAKDPNDEIICLMIDGTLTTCVYNKKSETLAWSRTTTEGSYVSHCVTDDPTGSSKWYVVAREVEGATKYFVETVQAGELANQYMDAWVSKPTVNLQVTGLEYLEGKTVQVAVDSGDGIAIEPSQVVTDGTVTTKLEGTAVVGLAYTATLETLRTEGGNQAGTSQASLMAFSEVHLRLNNSGIPRVNGQIPSLRTPQMPMDTPPPLTSDDQIYNLLGRETKGKVIIEQDIPIRTEIVALYGKLRSSQV